MITEKQHRHFAKVLQDMVISISRQIVESNIPPGVTPKFPEGKAMLFLEKLRCTMDDIICIEYIDTTKFDTIYVYYGGIWDKIPDHPMHAYEIRDFDDEQLVIKIKKEMK